MAVFVYYPSGHCELPVHRWIGRKYQRTIHYVQSPALDEERGRD